MGILTRNIGMNAVLIKPLLHWHDGIQYVTQIRRNNIENTVVVKKMKQL